MTGGAGVSEQIKFIFDNHFRRERVGPAVMAVGKHRRFAIHLIGPARPEHRPDGEIFQSWVRRHSAAEGVNFPGTDVVAAVVKLGDVAGETDRQLRHQVIVRHIRENQLTVAHIVVAGIGH